MLSPFRAPAARPRLYLSRLDLPASRAAKGRFEVVAFRDPHRGRAYTRWPWWSPSKPTERTRSITLDQQTWDAIWLPPIPKDPS